jgi:hypothetical protein
VASDPSSVSQPDEGGGTIHIKLTVHSELVILVVSTTLIPVLLPVGLLICCPYVYFNRLFPLFILRKVKA